MSKRIVQLLLVFSFLFQAQQSHALMFGIPLVVGGTQGFKDAVSDPQARLFVVGGGIFFGLLGASFAVLGLILDENNQTNIDQLVRRIESFGAERREATELALVIANAAKQEASSGKSVTIQAETLEEAAPKFVKSERFGSFLISLK